MVTVSAVQSNGQVAVAICVALAVLFSGGCGDDGAGVEDSGDSGAGATDAAVDADTGVDADVHPDNDAGGGACSDDPDCDDHVGCTIDRCNTVSGACEHSAPDLDGDQHPDATCLGRDGTPLGDDCDDINANRFPGNSEACLPGHISSVTDEDCDPTTFGRPDTDRDSHVSTECCNADDLGVLNCGTDCDPHDGDVHPGAHEYCNTLDDDCDGEVDERSDTEGLYIDGDGDDYGNDTDVIDACTPAFSIVTRTGDCDDENHWRNPEGTETCDDVDNDCDEFVDEGLYCGACDCSPPRAVQVECFESATVCTIVQCDLGYWDCDGDVSNGCETNITAANNCGACGTVCGERADCVPNGWYFGCACDLDHELVDQSATECVDRDGCVDCGDCAMDNGGCDALVQCTQEGELRTCGPCPVGYAGNGNNGCRPILTGLAVDGGALYPALDDNTTRYRIDVYPLFDRVTLTPSAIDGATLSIDGRSIASSTPWLSPVVRTEVASASGLGVLAGSRLNSYAFLYQRSTHVTYVKSSNTQPSAAFGGAPSWGSQHPTRTVDLDAAGTTLVVGAPGEPDGDLEPAYRGGAVYVYTRSSSEWAEQVRLTTSTGGAYELFGIAVAIAADGNTLAIGAPSLHGDPETSDDLHAGRVYVYDRNGADWTLRATLTAANAEHGDRFGMAVSLSADGSTLAIGAPGEASNARGVDGDRTNNDAIGAGAVYVFDRSGDVWSERAYLKASNAGPFDSFGTNLALTGSGDTLVIGAPTESSNATEFGGSPENNSMSGAGAAYVFERELGVWSEGAYVKPFDTRANLRFGASVAVGSDGTTIAIGAPFATGVWINGELVGEGTNWAIGAVYVYDRASSGWGRQAFLKPSTWAQSSQFGAALAVSATGRHVIVGSPGAPSSGEPQPPNPPDSPVPGGAVYAFSRGVTGWRQSTPVYASNATYYASFGASIAVSADLSITAVGAPGEDSAATGINGDPRDQAAPDSGAVYVLD